MSWRPSASVSRSPSARRRSLTITDTVHAPPAISKTMSDARTSDAASTRARRRRGMADSSTGRAAASASLHQAAISSSDALSSASSAGIAPSRCNRFSAVLSSGFSPYPSATAQRPSPNTAQTRRNVSSMSSWRISTGIPFAAALPFPFLRRGSLGILIPRLPFPAAADRTGASLPPETLAGAPGTEPGADRSGAVSSLPASRTVRVRSACPAFPAVSSSRFPRRHSQGGTNAPRWMPRPFFLASSSSGA